jgi:hypothetical protein
MIAGFLVDKIAGAFQFIATIVAKNPFNAFSESTIKSVNEASAKLDQLRAKLQNYDYDIRKIGEINRNIASNTGFELPQSLFGSEEIKKTADAIGQVENRIYSLAETQKGFLEVTGDVMAEFQANAITAADASANGFQGLAKRIVENNVEVAKSLQSTFASGAGNAFAAFGQALATGEDGLAAFGKAVLSAFGDMLIMLGTQVMAVGLGMSAVPILFGFQGSSAVAAGAAMLVPVLWGLFPSVGRPRCRC